MNGWRSANEIGAFDTAEPEPWERTTEDPSELERAQAQRERRAREREKGER
jgi:hypothetical protein